ncbi:hypothetical protein [Thalassomonas sp. RHCl1]|uniref:hypothetical protein n=1 Tax=Thalassomonas sp. RHCl1 TaxID=2995320 RepID=UPI00248C2BE2|nr:hypothetical protein [Thalassomonas sp. RHCl1]
MIAATTSFASLAATHQTVWGSSAWGSTYGEAYNGAYANITAKYPGVHEIQMQCIDMSGGWWKCAARGVIDV